MTQVPANCPHDLRPGVTVCLRCLQEQRTIARARIRTIAGLSGAAVLVLAILIAGGVSVYGRMNSDDAVPPPDSKLPTATPVGTAAASTAAPLAATPAPVERAVLQPAVAEGRTDLREGVSAQRSGDTVTVGFDTMMERTRRPEKFEQIVRSTLPTLFGSEARAALETWPRGSVARAGDLTGELPTRGLRIPLRDGSSLLVVPKTRQGASGPLVVGYRATVVRP